MNLDDLAKLAGIQKIDAPVEQPVEAPVAEQPMNGREDMKAMIALIDPEVLNRLGAEAPVEEEGYANSGDHYSGEPEEYKGTLGSPADLSLRRYLGANGMPVNVDETKVYEDHKVEDITEAYAQYKAGQNEEVVAEADCACETHEDHSSCADDCDCNESVTEGKVGTPGSLDKVEAQIEKLKDMAKKARADGDPQKANDIESSDEMTELLRKQRKLKKNESVTEGRMKDEMIDDAEKMSKSAFIKKYGEENAGTWESVNESIEEAVVDEDDVEEDNAFNSAAAKAKKAGDSHFSFNGKKYKVKMDTSTADSLTDDIAVLRQLAGV